MTARDELVRIALGEQGEPYGAHRDCSGFTAWAYRQVGVTIPEGSVAQFGVGVTVPSKAHVQAGDLVFWDTFGPAPGHVALAINPSQVIHALNPDKGIMVSGINAEMGGPYMGARRILEDAPRPKAPVSDPTGNKDPALQYPQRNRHERRKARRLARQDRREAA